MSKKSSNFAADFKNDDEKILFYTIPYNLRRVHLRAKRQ